MSNWINVAKITDIPSGSSKAVQINHTSILIFNLDGDFYAIENVCTHDGGSLAGGHLEGDEIVCPRHGAHFCIKTGAVTQPPAYEDVATFAVQVVGDLIQLQLSH